MGLLDSIDFPIDDELRQFLEEFDATNGRMYQNNSRPDMSHRNHILSPIRPKYYGRKPSNNLRAMRALRLMTQSNLAAKTGTTRRTIIRIEQNQRVPSVYLAVAIAQALEMKVEDIFSLPPLTPVPPSKY